MPTGLVGVDNVPLGRFVQCGNIQGGSRFGRFRVLTGKGGFQIFLKTLQPAAHITVARRSFGDSPDVFF